MKPILVSPDDSTSEYIDKVVKRYRDTWKRATGRGPLLAALGKAFAMAKVDFTDCPTMTHASAKAYSLLSRPQPVVIQEEGN